MKELAELFKKAVERYSYAITERPLYFDCFIICSIVLFFSLNWLCPKVPSDDFPGNVSLLWFFRTAFGQGDFPFWCQKWFCGFPLTMLYSKFLSVLFCLPFTLIFGDILGLKVALITGHMISGIAMYFVIFDLLKDKNSALVGALIYCIHPIYLTETAIKGHMEVSLFYMFVPLVFRSMWRVIQQPSLRNIVISSIVITLGLWTNNEGAVSVYPFLVIPLVFEIFTRNKPFSRRALVQITIPFIVVVLLSVGLSAFFIVPVTMDLGLLNTFSEEYVTRTVEQFSLDNIFYFFNRDNVINTAFDDTWRGQLFIFGGDFYCGIVPLFLTLFYLIMKSYRSDKKVYIYSILLAAGILFSFGPYCLNDVIVRFISKEPDILLFLFVFLLNAIILSASGLFIVSRKYVLSPAVFFIVTAIAIILTCVPFYSLLTKTIPLYDHSRSPQWFLISLAPLSLAFIGALAFERLSGMCNKKPGKAIFLVLLCCFIIVDFLPYKDCFSHFEPEPRIKSMQKAYLSIREDSTDCRTLSIETYEPALDLGPLYSNKSAGWYWLNWTCLRNTAQLLFHNIYPNLWRGEHEQAQGVSAILGIRYFVDDRIKKANLADEERYISLYRDRIFSVHQNPRFSNSVRIYKKKAVYIGNDFGRKCSLMAYLSSKNVSLVDIPHSDLMDIIHDIDYIFWDTQKMPSLKKAIVHYHPDNFFDMTKGDPIEILKSRDLESMLKWTRPSNDEITVSLNTNETVLVTIAESYHPFWTASSASITFRILPVNHAIMGIVIPSGKHEIMFRYRPSWNYFSGVIITVLTICLIVGLLITEQIRKVKRFELW